VSIGSEPIRPRGSYLVQRIQLDDPEIDKCSRVPLPLLPFSVMPGRVAKLQEPLCVFDPYRVDRRVRLIRETTLISHVLSIGERSGRSRGSSAGPAFRNVPRQLADRDGAVVANAAVIEGAVCPVIFVSDVDADHCFVARIRWQENVSCYPKFSVRPGR
jgi:hypothetical protein